MVGTGFFICMTELSSGTLVGHIQLYEGQGNQLVAICGHCGIHVNRSYQQWRGKGKPENHPQGRPMGSLLAWLFSGCPGEGHKEAMKRDFGWETRNNARNHGIATGTLTMAYALERPRFPKEIEDGLWEPLQQC